MSYSTHAEVIRGVGALYDEIQLLALGLEGAFADANAEDTAVALEGVKELRRVLAIVQGDLESQLVKRLPTRNNDLPIGRFERLPNISRTEWKHDELLPKVLRTLLVAPLQGDLSAVEDCVEAIVTQLPAKPSWRVGKKDGLPALGFDPADWCHEEKDGYTVKVTLNHEKLLTELGVDHVTQKFQPPPPKEKNDGGGADSSPRADAEREKAAGEKAAGTEAATTGAASSQDA